MRSYFLMFGLASLSLTACASGAGESSLVDHVGGEQNVEQIESTEADETGSPELSVASSATGLSARTSAVAPPFAYVTVTRRDFRRCAFPLCGGVFVKAVDGSLLTCANGTVAAECHVPAVSYPHFASETDRETFVATFERGVSVARAEIVRAEAAGIPYGKLVIGEAHQARLDRPVAGRLGTLRSEVCGPLPCDPFTLQPVHEESVLAVRRVTFAPAIGVEGQEVALALATNGGVLVAGKVTERPKFANVRVEQFYNRVDVRAPGGDGAACGGLTGEDCRPGLYCSFAREDICGAADAMGVCRVKPEVCAEIYAPVCGCDDKTYANECDAARAGVSVAFDGPCFIPTGESCGGKRLTGPTQCAPDAYCKFTPPAICGRGDAPGTCTTKPEACTREYMPVCGCNGVTYSNRCEAAAAGVSVDYTGSCRTR